MHREESESDLDHRAATSSCSTGSNSFKALSKHSFLNPPAKHDHGSIHNGIHGGITAEVCPLMNKITISMSSQEYENEVNCITPVCLSSGGIHLSSATEEEEGSDHGGADCSGSGNSCGMATYLHFLDPSSFGIHNGVGLGTAASESPPVMIDRLQRLRESYAESDSRQLSGSVASFAVRPSSPAVGINTIEAGHGLLYCQNDLDNMLPEERLDLEAREPEKEMGAFSFKIQDIQANMQGISHSDGESGVAQSLSYSPHSLSSSKHQEFTSFEGQKYKRESDNLELGYMEQPEAEPMFGSTSAPLPHEFWEVLDPDLTMGAVEATMSHPLPPTGGAPALRPALLIGDIVSPSFMRVLGNYLDENAREMSESDKAMEQVTDKQLSYMSVMPTSGDFDELRIASDPQKIPEELPSFRKEEGSGGDDSWQSRHHADINHRTLLPLPDSHAIRGSQSSSSMSDSTARGPRRRILLRGKTDGRGRGDRDLPRGAEARLRRCVLDGYQVPNCIL